MSSALTRVVALAISSSDWPTRAAISTPRLARAVESSIIAAVLFAASAERWASERTSSATTANPLPASPARAASTAAFSASRLVWNAISSITLMILAISALESLISDMAVDICCISRWPLRAAVCEASETSLAERALSAF